MKKNIFKFVFDIGMALLLILLYPVELTGLKFHEIAGITLGLPFVIHLLVNWKWITSITRKLFTKNTPRKTKFSYVLSLLLLLDMLVVIISGLFISHILFPNLRQYSSGLPLLSIHISSASLGLILVGIHVGLHWKWIKQIGKQLSSRLFKNKKSIAIKKPLLSFLKYISLGIGTVLLVSTLAKAAVLPVTIFSGNVNDKASESRGGHGQQINRDKGDFGAKMNQKGDRNDNSSPISTAFGLTFSVITYFLLLGAAAYYTHLMENQLIQKRKRASIPPI